MFRIYDFIDLNIFALKVWNKARRTIPFCVALHKTVCSRVVQLTVPADASPLSGSSKVIFSTVNLMGDNRYRPVNLFK